MPSIAGIRAVQGTPLLIWAGFQVKPGMTKVSGAFKASIADLDWIPGPARNDEVYDNILAGYLAATLAATYLAEPCPVRLLTQPTYAHF